MPAAAEDKFVALTMPQAPLFSLERLVRQRKQFVDDATRTKLRVEAAADTYIPGLFDALGKDPLTAGKRVLLRRFMDPQRIVDAGVDGMRKVLREQKRRVSTSILERVYTTACDAHSIWQPLRDEGCCPVDFRVAQEMISRYLDLLEDFQRHIEALQTSIAAIALAVDGYDAVRSSPGIGDVICAGVLANTGDIRRFPNGNKYVSYCGLAPRKNQTGESDRKGQKITKAGKPILRKYYYLAAEKARRIDPELAAFYQRKIDEGKHHETVVVAIAAKLARRVHAILKRSIAGDDVGYRIYGPNNEPLSAREAACLVKARFPSKAARKKAQLAASKAKKKRPQARHEKRPPKDAAQAGPQALHDSRRAGLNTQQDNSPLSPQVSTGGDLTALRN
jgi:transposase